MNNYKKIIPPSLLIIGAIGVILDQIYRVSSFAGNPVFVVSLVVLFISFTLFFVHEKVILAWCKLACLWVPLSFIIVSVFPLDRGGFLPPETDRGILSIILWSSFLFTSLILIAYKSYKLRGK